MPRRAWRRSRKRSRSPTNSRSSSRSSRRAAALVRLTAVEAVRPGFGHPFLPVLSSWDRLEAAVHAGHPDVAARALARFAPWAQVAGPAWALPVLADCRALAAAPDEADAHF